MVVGEENYTRPGYGGPCPLAIIIGKIVLFVLTWRYGYTSSGVWLLPQSRVGAPEEF